MSEIVDYEGLPKSEKSWMVCLVLILFPLCCMVGAHHWYCGNTMKALLRFIPIVGWILGFIDLIALFQGKFMDSEGAVVRKG